MSSPNDPRLMGTVWADEARRTAGSDAAEARAHRDEDEETAISRAESTTPARPNLVRRILNRLTGR